MPKMKSNKAARKRFKINKNGVIKRSCQNGAKHLTRKSAKRKMRLKSGDVVSKADAPAIARAIRD
ncbi:MAG: 50S ribosomal protein L35 [Firmicutes bacterium]|nr:50S ribosomal protein L35 [Bacillota bacterium]